MFERDATPTEKYAILVRDALDDVRFHDQYGQKTLRFPYHLHHATREMRCWSGGPITERDIKAFNIGVRVAIQKAIRVLQEGKWETMTQNDVDNMLHNIEARR